MRSFPSVEHSRLSDVHYVAFQSIGHANFPNDCNLCSMRLVYRRTLPGSSSFVCIRLLRNRRACKLFAALITNSLSRPTEAEGGGTCPIGGFSGGVQTEPRMQNQLSFVDVPR